MPKIRYHEMDIKERRRIVGELLDVVTGIKSKNEMFELLFRLLTPSEVVMLARRLQIAKMLLKEFSYEDIRKEHHASHRTIADVEGWLRESPERADLVRKRLQSIRKKEGKANTYSENMLDKYAHHRFLKNLLG